MKALKSLIFCLIVFLGVSSYAKAAPLSLDPRILYVKQGGTSVNCTSWDDACGLQTALLAANPGDQVWVAKGTYKPTTTNSDPRTATFQLESGVAIYGGFPVAGGTWEQRDWATNLTTLSGDIGSIGDSSDNSYHVVTGSGVDATAILNGFTISGGNANISYPHDRGGGMYNYSSSSPTLTNVTFSGNSAYYGGGMYNDASAPVLNGGTFSANSASYGGGGMYNSWSSSPVLTNVTFSGNSATSGGGMYNWNSSSPVLNNVTFSGNSASYGGGGIINSASSPALTNVTFSNNTASSNGGGMYNYNSSSPTLTNAIVWGNTPTLEQIYNDGTSPATITYSDIQNWTSGVTGNISSDPLLGSLADNGGFTQTHALGYGSPAIDAGDPAVCTATDQRGFPRPIDGDGNGSAICDMGAYEYDFFKTYLPLIMK